MKLLNKLDEILRIEYQQEKNIPKIVLKENKTNTCEDIIIKNDGNILVYKFDEVVKIGEIKADNFPYFKKEETIIGKPRTICDYIIFYSFKETLHVFICELKSGNTKTAKNQIYAGYLLARYLIDTAKRCLDIEEAQLKATDKSKETVKYKGFKSV